jgi:hypothetical protein
MEMRLSRRRLLAGFGTGVLSLTASTQSGRAADFYQGKALTVIVGFAPGGGVDTTARLVARHLARFIPASSCRTWKARPALSPPIISTGGLPRMVSRSPFPDAPGSSRAS